jgi:predicted DNA-binding antitoxin AbrB/MazE fold protein
MTISATPGNGVFKPLGDLQLKEGAVVEVAKGYWLDRHPEHRDDVPTA